jgi:hypothetical protein
MSWGRQAQLRADLAVSPERAKQEDPIPHPRLQRMPLESARGKCGQSLEDAAIGQRWDDQPSAQIPSQHRPTLCGKVIDETLGTTATWPPAVPATS